MRVVVIGNGVAGMRAAIAIRQRHPDWSITIVSEESDHFFSRTALMWICCGQLSHRDTEPFERDAYATHNFQRVRARCLNVDTDAHTIELAGELPALSYDRLLVATGSVPRPAPWPGSSLTGVGHFVTHQDLDWLQRELYGDDAVKDPPRPREHLNATNDASPYRFRQAASTRRQRVAKRVAVIGGGLIGIEAVEIARAAGATVDFFIREEWFWPVALNALESEWIAAQMREHGVNVLLERDVIEITGDDNGLVNGVRTAAGTTPSDCVVVAIGVDPNTQWLKSAAIVRDDRGGLIVDENQRTSAEDVYAAGDCASVKSLDGDHRVEQLWYTARDQGDVAGVQIAGEGGQYERGIWYNSAKLMDIEYTTVGFVNMSLPKQKELFYEEQGEIRSTTRIITQNDNVVGFNFLGRRWDHEILIQWIQEKRSLDFVLSHLVHAAFDTEFVPPLQIGRT